MARYYSFYTWAIKTVNSEEGISLQEIYKKMIKLETAFVISSILDKDMNFPASKDPTGIRTGRKILETSDMNNIDVREKVFKNKEGIFGQYYKSVMHQLKLFKRNQNETWLQLTENGELIADSFADQIKNTQYVRSYLFADKIPRIILQRLGTHSSYLRLKDNPRECTLLIKTFMDDRQVQGIQIPSRRKTLLLILDLIRESRSSSQEEIKDALRDLVLYKAFYQHDGTITIYNKPEFSDILKLWRFYEFNEQFKFALETIFCIFLKIIEISKTQGQKINKMDFLTEFSDIETYAGQICCFDFGEKKIVEIIQSINKRLNIQEDFSIESSSQFDDACKIINPMSEKNILKFINRIPIDEAHRHNFGEALGYAVVLILILMMRYFHTDDINDELTQSFVKRAYNELSIAYITRKYASCFSEYNISQFFAIILDEIITKHDDVARRKYYFEKRDTYRFEQLQGNFEFKKTYEVDIGTKYYFNTIISILEDLGLIDTNSGTIIVLTDEGRKVLEVETRNE